MPTSTIFRNTELLLKLFVHGQGDLWRDVDESLAQQQPDREFVIQQQLLEPLLNIRGAAFGTLLYKHVLQLLQTLHTLDTNSTDDTLSRAANQRFISHVMMQNSEYDHLSLGDVHHADDSEHLVWVALVITVLRYLRLLKHKQLFKTFIALII